MTHAWSVGLSTGCCWNASIIALLPVLRDYGFNKLEICSHPGHLDYHDGGLVRHVSELIRSLGLAAYSFHAPFKESIDISSFDDGVRALARHELIRALNAATILGVEFFVVHPGPEKTSFPECERIQRLTNAVGVLDEINHECRQRGPRLVLENMLPHLFAGRTENLLWILDGMKHGHDIGICIDTGHAFLGGELIHVVRLFSGRISMVHVSDNHGHRDDHLPPGDGAINWSDFLNHLAGSRFSGSLILEIAGPDDARITVDHAVRGRAYLQSVVTGALETR